MSWLAMQARGSVSIDHLLLPPQSNQTKWRKSSAPDSALDALYTLLISGLCSLLVSVYDGHELVRARLGPDVKERALDARDPFNE